MSRGSVHPSAQAPQLSPVPLAQWTPLYDLCCWQTGRIQSAWDVVVAVLACGTSLSRPCQAFIDTLPIVRRRAPAIMGRSVAFSARLQHLAKPRFTSMAPTKPSLLNRGSVAVHAAILDGEVQEALAESVVQAITVLGGGVLLFAAILTLVNLTLVYCNAFLQRGAFKQFMAFDRAVGNGPATVSRVRLQLAQLLALGLQILLCSDILETLVKSTKEYTFDSLYKLALVSAIRTGLSYFLGLETEEILNRAQNDGRMDGVEISVTCEDVADK